MKRLNKNGFTLIELLAVIVILAIIVVVTVPTVLNSINDARLSSLHSLSKEVANWYDTAVARDQLALTGNKILGTLIDEDTDTEINDGNWHCIFDLKSQNSNNENKSLGEIYGLSLTDIYHMDFGNKPVSFDINGKLDYPGPRQDEICSSIRIVNGRAEVFLVAKSDGKFDTNGSEWAYALSSGTSAYDTVNES